MAYRLSIIINKQLFSFHRCSVQPISHYGFSLWFNKDNFELYVYKWFKAVIQNSFVINNSIRKSRASKNGFAEFVFYGQMFKYMSKERKLKLYNIL